MDDVAVRADSFHTQHATNVRRQSHARQQALDAAIAKIDVKIAATRAAIAEIDAMVAKSDATIRRSWKAIERIDRSLGRDGPRPSAPPRVAASPTHRADAQGRRR